ncbi:hypothetical protein BDN70DRAFT_817603 [Pholiota conissans]|uniref:Uncharacterized protein n=1 Tax=Pholiota conissans TaxID=109636 RepID=A0A9P6CUI4_9AGAR|nr:hypothetical protein BDN70DRAFT_817603 [Pholiota conissans]
MHSYRKIQTIRQRKLVLLILLPSLSDYVFKNFIRCLQDHLLGRLLGHDLDGDSGKVYTPKDRLTVRIQNETIFRVCTARINYTTYDMRRAYDTVNPHTHPFIILSSPETDPGRHPFWYAAVIGIFHANVQHTGKDSRDYSLRWMEFLWVRWMGPVSNYSFGRQQARLPKIGFIPDSDEFAFGFLDPSLVLRGCHLLPSFKDGRTPNLLTMASKKTRTEARTSGLDDDWMSYYVGIFVDRDMLMRFLGHGVGHKGQTNCALCVDDTEDEDEGVNDDLDTGSNMQAELCLSEPLLGVNNAEAAVDPQDGDNDGDNDYPSLNRDDDNVDSDEELDDEVDLEGWL